MDQTCIFCQIISRHLPAGIVYEDDRVMAIVDLYPVNIGHLLIIPKKHTSAMQDMDADTLGQMMIVAKQMNLALRHSVYPCEGVNLFVADGEAAQQEIFHFHLHLYPRFAGDGFGFKYDPDRHHRKLDPAKRDEIVLELGTTLAYLRHKS